MSVLVLIWAAATGAAIAGLAIGAWTRRDHGGRARRRGNWAARRLPIEQLEAERRAEELLASVAGGEALESYRALGFLHAYGDSEDDGQPGYGYLIYPHRPLISFDARTRTPLSELCVSFPDCSGTPGRERLPDADDVLAKWIAIHGDELALLAAANVHAVGHQIDPAQARRDLLRLQEWTIGPTEGSASDGFATAQ